MNLPTKITLSRIVAVPVIIVLFYVSFSLHYIVAAAVFALAAITDIIDGKIARKTGQVTSLGKLLDPIADKILSCSLLIMMAANGDEMMYFNPPVGVILTSVVVAREILIGVFRTIAAHKGVILAADNLGKVKTIFLNVSIPFMMVSQLHIALKIIGNALFAVACILAVVSGVNYIIKNRGVLSEEETDA